MMPAQWSLNVDMARAAAEGVRRGGELILDEAKQRAPSLTGELRESGEVREISADGVRVTFTAPHARRQHNVDYEHPRGGERNFLENAQEHVRPQLEQLVAAEIRSRLGR
ncbi:HK97 gp10 family phage protein [Gordonia sp. UCD-TK1]|uniref:HK97 gp10 family phage protein n=2 Tax=Gordonia TaxID=2053 RepID=UPI0011122557|nr:HK97 gp10 family phage protein [Gordonia sp. UCD-TK1]